MIDSFVRDSAFSDIELLDQVVRFKDKFYRCPWARYELARTGTIKLIPIEENIKVLKEDYGHMQNMIFGEKPDFDIILEKIKKLEDDVNLVNK